MNQKEAHRTDADVQRRVEEIISGAQVEAAAIVQRARQHAALDEAAVERLVSARVQRERADELKTQADVKRASFAELAEQARSAQSFFDRAREVTQALTAAAHAEQHVQELTAEVECVKAQIVQATAQRDAVLRERDAALVERNRLEAEAGDFEARLAAARQRARDLINGAQQ
jgi:hypothetical protein